MQNKSTPYLPETNWQTDQQNASLNSVGEGLRARHVVQQLQGKQNNRVQRCPIPPLKLRPPLLFLRWQHHPLFLH